MEVIGGIVGFRGDAPVALAWLRQWVECNLRLECIAPHGTDRSNHRQDQSGLNLLLHQYSIKTRQLPRIHAEPRYWAYLDSDDPLQYVADDANPSSPVPSGVLLLSRRGRWPKPYMKALRTCGGASA